MGPSCEEDSLSTDGILAGAPQRMRSDYWKSAIWDLS